MINWVGVGLGVVASFFVGYIWYHPLVFGEEWRKLIKMDKKTMQKGPDSKGWFFATFAAFFQSYITAHVTYLSFKFFNDSWMVSAVQTAFWLWLGLQLSTLITMHTFEQRPYRLTLINAGNQLATMLLIGLLIGLFQP